MNRPNLHPQPLPNTRLATMEDFRNDGQLILDIQYWEYMFGSWTWELRWTEFETDREWLKAKLLQGYIIVMDPPERYNQKSIEEIFEYLKESSLELTA